MTTLPGLASKGEKGKSKYQSLDINSLYRSSRGEKEETQQQKNTLPRKHGMQILGRVPNARRPPANLPSLKSEHSGSDQAVSLVPSGGPGWGKQENAPGQAAPAGAMPPAIQQTSIQNSSTSPATGLPQSAQVAPVAQAVPPQPPTQQMPPSAIVPSQSPKQPPVQSINVAQPATASAVSDKSWSAVMAGADLGISQPPPYHSAQFQHEFPSLDGATTNTGPNATGAGGPRGGVDMQYGPGPSLRPQTEGSWMQGGSRATSGNAPAAETGQPILTGGTTAGAGQKTSSGPPGGPPQHAAPVGQAASQEAAPPPQFRGILPNFMCRGNFAPNEQHGNLNFHTATNPLSGRGRFPTPPMGMQQQQHQGGEGRPPPPQRGGPPPAENDDLVHRPIIREEELSRMDDMTRDVGWASHDDIDYNQKLAFSDDELQERENHRDREKEREYRERDREQREREHREREREHRERERDRDRDHREKERDLNRDRERDRDRDTHSQKEYSQPRELLHKKTDVEKMEQSNSNNENTRVPNNSNNQMIQNRGWNNPRQVSQPATPQQNRQQINRRVEDDELWEQRRRQQSEEVAIAVERAKLRKEEEEKRYLETKQAAAKKLQELENKIKEKKGEEIRETEEGTINPSTIPPQPITPAPIPVPEWERGERERERSRTPNEPTQEKHPRDPDFRQLTQIEGRNFIPKNRSSDREISREREMRDNRNDPRDRDAPNFSRHFQSNLPPRFQKQQAERQNTSTGNYHQGAHQRGGQSSPQPQSNTNVPFAQQYDPRWVNQNSSNNFPKHNAPRNRKEDYEKHESENHSRQSQRDRHTPDTERNYESNRRISGGDRYYDDYRNYRREGSQEYDYKHDRTDHHRNHYDERKDSSKKDEYDDIHRQDSNSNSNEWRREKYIHKESSEERVCSGSERQETSQRPDSRDSRISKDSLRDVDYTCWADSPFEPTYDDPKKKESYREERRQVPGPITKDRIEADENKSEKRNNLIQLKRSESSKETKKDDKDKKDVKPESENPQEKQDNTENKNKKLEQKSDVIKKDLDKDKDRNRMDSRGSSHRNDRDRDRNWGNTGTVYNSSWPKRGDGRSSRGSQRSTGRRHKDMPHSDSEFSGDEFSNSVSTESGKEDRKHKPNQNETKVNKKTEKDDKNLKDKDRQEKRRDDKRFDSNRDRDRGDRDRDRDRDRDNRDRDNRDRRDPYIPRGEPTRHGRGGFGSRGSRPIVSSKRIDGYGIPPSKSPFGNHDDNIKENKKLSGDEIGGEAVSSDEKTKQNQQALSAGIIGSGNRNPPKNESVPPRIQHQKNERRDRSKGRDRGERAQSDSRKSKPRSKHSDENWETSDYSDTDDRKDRKDRERRKPRTTPPSTYGHGHQSSNRNAPISRNAPPPRSTVPNPNPAPETNQSKKTQPSSTFNKNEPNTRQNSNPNLRNPNEKGLKKDSDVKEINNTFVAAIENVKQQQKEKIERSDSGENPVSEENSDEKSFDTEGFQEVKSKKNVIKERKDVPRETRNVKVEKDINARVQKYKSNTTQLTPQQIANIPPLLATPVNPPSNMTSQSISNNKSSFERARQNKLAPRFAKQRENRMAKQQMQNLCDVSEMNKINQNVSMYNMKENTTHQPTQVTNAWEKPITQLRNDPNEAINLNMAQQVQVENCAEMDQPQQSQTSSQRSSPNTEKLLPKPAVQDNKALLDGTTPPVNTIIFENTNYKSAPVTPPSDIAVKAKFNTQIKTTQQQQQRPPEKPQSQSVRKIDESAELVEAQVMTGFNKPISDMLNKTNDANKSMNEPIQMPLSFNKAEDNADMKLDFTFDSDLTQLTDDKSSLGNKSLGLPRSMHAMTSAQSTISPSTADLNFKIASVKKVWETTMPTVLEHNVGQEDNVTNASATFSSSFGPDPNALDHSAAFVKGADQTDETHEGYSPSPNQSGTSNNTTNVCKMNVEQVKPTQQLSGTGQAVHSVSTHHNGTPQHPGSTGQHSAMVGQNLMGHPLSPPPMPVLGANVGLGQPPQQFANNQHINYQPSLGGSAQYGSMSAIPSPPNVLFNSTQQMPTQGGLYGPFQLDQTQVLNTQGRSQYSQYPTPYGLGQTASSPYSAQSIYLQTPPHPPPSAQPPPDIYQNISSQYRMAATGPFGQSQQLTNNPSTVLISSTSNSLMSATVKPSTQQISAIDLMSALGTKAGTVGQAYQQQSQQGQQLYIPYDPSLQANYLSSTSVLQRGPTGPVQNNVVPGLQPSSSYYSGSAGAQTGFYQQPGNSTLQSAQLHGHQTSFGLQGNVFGTHNQSHASAGFQGLSSQFLTSPMQMAAAAALSAQQQYRSPNLPNQNYLKGIGTQHMADQSGRSQQLKSPGANQDVLASVFNSAPQIPSPKSRQNCKQPPPQTSPTQHKYVSPYQNVNSQQAAQIQPRYPAPIQRPVNFQPTLNNSLQGSGNVGQRHRPTHNQNSRGPQKQYYGGQGGGMQSSQSDKSDDSKLIENGSSVTITSSNQSNSGAVTKNTASNQSADAKDTGSKDETIQNKE